MRNVKLTSRGEILPFAMLVIFAATIILAGSTMISKTDIIYDPLISISKNSDFSTYASSGDGSAGNPWIIENKWVNPGSSEWGIIIQSTTNYFILRNCNATGGTYGIIFINVVNGRLERCNTYSSTIPVSVLDGNNIQIINCTFKDPSLFMDIVNVYNIRIIGCNMSRPTITSSHAMMEFNIAHDVTIANCTSKIGQVQGVSMNNIGNDISIHNNTFTGYGKIYLKSNLAPLSNVTISNNTLSGSAWGIYLQYINGAIVENNTIKNTALEGVTFFQSRNVNLSGNILYKTGDGYYSTNSINCTVSRDTVSLTGGGSHFFIMIASGVNMSFYNTTFNWVNLPGSGSLRVVIDSDSKNTTFSGNSFINSKFYDYSTSTSWYKKGRGNYYSDHAAGYPYALSNGGTWWNSPRYFLLPSASMISRIKFDPFPLTPYITKSSMVSIAISAPLAKTPQLISAVTADVVDRQGQGISTVRYFVSNATWKSSNVTMTNVAGTWSSIVPSEVYSHLVNDGLYSVNVHAIDGIGVENWNSRLFKIDNNDAPLISILKPTPSLVISKSVLVEADVIDPDGVDEAWCRVRNSTWASGNHTMAGSPYSFDLDVSEIVYGLYYIDVFARDDLGNIISAQTWTILYPGLYDGIMEIFSHADFAKYGLPGDGSAGNPWIIEGRVFDAFSTSSYSIGMHMISDHAVIRDCTFYGLGTTVPRSAIMLTTVSNVVVEQSSFSWYTDPIVVTASSVTGNIAIDRCDFIGSINPIRFQTSFTCDDNKITGCTFTGTTGSWDIQYYFGDNFTVSENELDCGITIFGGKDINVSDNYFSSPPIYGIWIQSCINATISGNTFVDSVQYCINVQSIDHSYIHGNNFMRNYQAIFIKGSSNVWNNTFDDVYTFISINSNQQIVIIWNNTFTGTTDGGYFYVSGSYVFFDNGTRGNTWWNYLEIYPHATNDGKIWSEPYLVPGTLALLDHFPVVNAIDSRSTVEFIKPGSAWHSNIMNVTVRMHVIPSAVKYTISDGVHYYGKYPLSEIKPNVYSLIMVMNELETGTYNLTVYVTRSGKTTQFTMFFDYVDPQMEIVEPETDFIAEAPFHVVVVCSNGATSAKFQVVGSYPSANYTMNMDPGGITFRDVVAFDPSIFAGIATENMIIVYAMTPFGELSTSILFYYNAFLATVDISKPVGTSHASTIDIVVHVNDADGVSTVHYTITKSGGGLVNEGFLVHGAGDLYSGTASILESDNYDIMFVVTDGFGLETASIQFPFVVDISIVTISNPLPNSVAGEILQITAAFSGTPDKAWYFVTGDYTSAKKFLTYIGSNYFTGEFLPGSFPGMSSENLLEVFINDTDGNIFSSSVMFKYNADLSTIIVEFPGNYETNPSMAISVNCVDVDGIKSVRYEMKDGTTVIRSGPLSLVAGKYMASALVGTLGSKRYTLVIYALDLFDFETAAEKAFDLDLTNPVITPVVPHHDGATYTTATFPASVEVDDEFPVTSVHCRVAAPSGNIDFDLSQTSTGVFVAIPPRAIPAGVLVVTFTATSASGRVSSMAIQFNIDLAPPVIVPVSVPANGTRLTSSTFIISATCTDDTVIRRVSILVSNSSKEFNLTVTKDGSLYSATVNTTQIFDSNYTITIMAIDIQGRSSMLKRTVMIDVRFPIVAILIPVAGSLFNSTTTSIFISVVASIIDESVGLVSCVLWNSSWSSVSVTMERSPDGKYRATISVSNIRDGTYTLELFMTSNSGRAATSSVQVAINVSEPGAPSQPNLFQQFFDWIVGIVSSIVAFIAGLLGLTLVKRKRSTGNCIGGECNI